MAPNKSIDQQSASSGFGVQDVLFVLFRHKWKIILLSLLGFGAAATLYVKQTPIYESQANLLVKYVIAHSNVDAWEQQAEVGGRSGDHITAVEIAILRSRDLARSVVERVGIEHFVGDDETHEALATNEEEDPADEPATEDPEEEAAKGRRGSDPRLALGAIRFLSNLEVGAANGSKVIEIRYRHEDPQIVQRVLDIYVDEYFDKHLAIYRPIRVDFQSLKDEESALRLKMPGLRTALRDMEELLRETSRGDTTEFLKEQRGGVQAGLLQAQADFAQQKMLVEMLTEGANNAKGEADDEEEGDPLAIKVIPVATPQVVQQLHNLLALERTLQQKKLELGAKFLPGAGALAAVEGQIADLQQQRQALIEQHPGLEKVAVAVAVAQRGADGGQVDLHTEATQLAAIQSRVETYQSQLKALEERFFALSKLESGIGALKEEITEDTSTLEDLGDRLKIAGREQKIDHRNIPNIDILEHPTDPARVRDKKAMKVILGVAGSGIALGLALAFLLEIVIDRRVKRPTQIESLMHMPLMLTIPRLGGVAKAPRLEFATGEDADGEKMPLVPVNKRRSSRSDQILPYTEAIRDRLLYYFELNEMYHMPKLIALTGLSDGAGASTLAAGVATAFAQAEAKVLLVDLHSDQQGCGGLIATNGSGDRPTSLGIDGDSGMTFNTAGLNLSLASFGGRTNGNGASTLAPKKFYELIPKFRGSDFDYVIFDMPAIGATSATAAMAGFMDKVVLVLDAENTDREDLKCGYAELMRGKADVSCVFNKARNNAPRWVEG